ncbi:MAG: hypothetical protein JWR80_7492 [Bradyrhizobium sp.]|nr:hypothetical protein [Bradyrhizobium sp.]
MPVSNQRRVRGGAEAPAEPPRANLYDEVTAKIIAELEAGRIPWVQPWGGVLGQGGTAPGLPRNALTARAYSGVNVLILWGAVIDADFPSQSWLTFKQALDAGGCVRKGERGTTVVYADRFIPKGEGGRDQETLRGSVSPERRAARTEEGGGDQSSVRGADDPRSRTIPFLKRFTVFNVAQCEGLRPGLAADPAPLPDREIVPNAEALIAATGADFRIGGSRAYYSPGHDFVAVPPQPSFYNQINYYRTCLHELTHWTGHKSRLARDFTHGYGTQGYAREELAAEMGSAFLCAALGIVPTVRHADYIAGWLDILRADNRAIFRAASAASKAADFLLKLRDDADTATAADAGRIAA